MKKVQEILAGEIRTLEADLARLKRAYGLLTNGTERRQQQQQEVLINSKTAELQKLKLRLLKPYSDSPHEALTVRDSTKQTRTKLENHVWPLFGQFVRQGVLKIQDSNGERGARRYQITKAGLQAYQKAREN